MDRPWLQHYPTGVPATIDPHAYPSVQAILDESCRRFADRPAFSNLGASISYRRLDRLSRAFAAYLQHVVGLQRGERVALMMPNLMQVPVAMFGALRAGFTVVNVNPLYTERELEYQLADSGASAIVVLENFAHTLQAVLPRTLVRSVITTQVGDLVPTPKRQLVNTVVKRVKHMVPPWQIAGSVSFTRALHDGAHLEAQGVALGAEDIAFLQYTGGTTGLAKGTILTHGNLVANLQQLSSWIAGDLREGEEVAVLPLPLYHVYALTVSLVVMKIGAEGLLITNPRDLPAFLHTLRKQPFTLIVGVNTLFNALLNRPEFSALDFSRLKLACAGGMAVQRAVAERWKKTTGVPIVEGYGLTETSPVVTSNRLDITDWTGTIGFPLPSTDVAVLDESGRPLAQGEVGEIAVRGPQVMKGYWNRPEETARAFTQDGWLLTGDMGCMDESGRLRITDRKKDMIIVSGFKVFPNEVEDVAALHPGVLEAAAIGVPDAKSGEAVKLVVVKKDPQLTEAQLLEHCRVHLTGYKQPRSVEFRSEPLPKSNIGKILRRELRQAGPAGLQR